MFRIAGLAAVVSAGVMMAAPDAEAAPGHATVFTHSAEGGAFRDGRLVLHGVRGRMTYATNAGRTGAVSVRWAHRWLFVPRMRATGTLHVAGHRGGVEPTFTLSRPRHNAARRTVSYRAKPLDSKRLPGRGAGIPRRFGAASLSILPSPRLTGGAAGGPSCGAELDWGLGPASFAAQSSSIGVHNEWDDSQPNTKEVEDEQPIEGSSAAWGSYADAGYGCSNTVTFLYMDRQRSGWTVTVTVTWEPGDTPSYTCTSAVLSCQYRREASPGHAVFEVLP